MSKAFENAIKLRAWVDPVALGADPTGVLDADAYMSQAVATGLPLRFSGTLRLAASLAVVLADGQDFILNGSGQESARLVFATGGLSVTYNGRGQSFGDKTSISIDGISIEAESAGTSDALRIINSVTDVVNDTAGNVSLTNLAMSGTTGPAYWANAIYLENVAFPHISSIKVEDGGKRTTALSIATVGSYNSVDTTVTDFKCWEVAAGIKVRGRVEGVYLNQFVVIGGTTGVDWVATITAGKKPLLLLDGCHINVVGTAVKTVDVAQVIAADSLLYIPNSSIVPSYGFDFQATSAASSENNRINGCTIIGQGDRTGSLSTAVRCGANVFGVSIEVTADNVGTCVDTISTNRTSIAAGSRLTNYNVRSVGMYDVAGVAGGVSGGVSVDTTLQIEQNGADSYSRDVYREQIRARSFTFNATAAAETITYALPIPFRTDTSVLLCNFGADPGNPAAFIYADLTGSTEAVLSFRTKGLTIGAPYRISYIAYGY